GIKDVLRITTLRDEYERNFFDTTTFTELIAVVGNTTWEVMNAKKALKIEWEEDTEKNVVISGFGGQKQNVTIPAGLETTEVHKAKLLELSKKPAKILRRDG